MNRDTYGKNEAVPELRERNATTVADLHDKLRLSRKYAQAILEYFGTIGLTKREKDRHVMK